MCLLSCRWLFWYILIFIVCGFCFLLGCLIVWVFLYIFWIWVMVMFFIIKIFRIVVVYVISWYFVVVWIVVLWGSFIVVMLMCNFLVVRWYSGSWFIYILWLSVVNSVRCGVLRVLGIFFWRFVGFWVFCDWGGKIYLCKWGRRWFFFWGRWIIFGVCRCCLRCFVVFKEGKEIKWEIVEYYFDIFNFIYN